MNKIIDEICLADFYNLKNEEESQSEENYFDSEQPQDTLSDKVPDIYSSIIWGNELGMGLQMDAEWEPGRILQVEFLGGSSSAREKVIQYAREWSQYANIIFCFEKLTERADIRVGFENSGNWSYLGQQALKAKSKQTINLANVERRYVLHEFGHVLACIHEHSTPKAGIKWDKSSVYRDLEGRWTKEIVDRNVLYKYSETQTQYTEFDPESIMVYPIPKHWTTNGYSVGWNEKLSSTDQKYINSIYPGFTMLFITPKVMTGNCTVIGMKEFKYNSAGYPHCWVMSDPGEGYIEITFNHERPSGERESGQTSQLSLAHGSVRGSSDSGNAIIDIYINDKLFKQGYVVPPYIRGENLPRASFENIASMLKEGVNKMRIQLSEKATADYAIAEIKLS